MVSFLYCVLSAALILSGVHAQQCVSDNGADYLANPNGDGSPGSGFIVTLYSISSLGACCSACAGFQEAVYYSWVSSSGSCICKNSNVHRVTNSAVNSGIIQRTMPVRSGACNTITSDTDYNNGFLASGSQSTITGCCSMCQNFTNCNYFTYVSSSQQCYLKGTNSNNVTSNGATVGSVVTARTVPLRTGKRGLAWFDSLSCSDLKLMNNVAWIYNWGPQPEPALQQCINDLGIEWIPMQWGTPLALQNMYLPSTHMLTFNEPNFNGQSQILPAQAAGNWSAIQAFAAAHNLQLGSPAVAAGGSFPNSQVGDPIHWLDLFFGNCTQMYGSNGCKVDFITTHIYTNPIGAVKGYLSQFKKYNKPIWLTEFSYPIVASSSTGLQDVVNFMNATLADLEADPAYARYAWFGTRIAPTDGYLGSNVNLFSSQGSALTPVGTLYTTFPSSSSSTTSGSSTTTTGATAAPTVAPTKASTVTPAPTSVPSKAPSVAPTKAPTNAPTKAPTSSTTTTGSATAAPTHAPTKAPTATPAPSKAPTQGPTVAPTLAATSAPTSGYIGCYVDSTSARDLSTQGPQFVSTTTVEKCRYWCGERHFAYAGLQYAQECFCGNTYGSLGSAPNSDCNMACTGNAAEMCGAGNRNSIYTSGNVGYLGCYADGNTRDLPNKVASSSTMTIDSCRQLCYSNNYQYAGLQYAEECWCGNTYGLYGTSGANCNAACTGDNTEICGGGLANSVFTSMSASAYPGY